MYKKIMRNLGLFSVKHFHPFLMPLKEVLIKSSIKTLYEIYVGKMVLLSLIGFFATFVSVIALLLFLGSEFLLALVTSIAVSLSVFILILIVMHSYPFRLLRMKKTSIENNMPFAINHMSAISISGIPPFSIFKILSIIKEYGEVSRELAMVTRNVEVFGMDVNTSIKNVARRTPSNEFRHFLLGISSTIETGGSLVKYFESSAKEAIFDYKLKRQSYVQSLSTYADIYTAVLIAAPLFFVSVLSIMAIVGGPVMGFSIQTLVKIGIYLLIPLMNIFFILFIHYTQPG
ncbi:MAG: type II secretion system F family protein [Candidatus Aenigmatarchaeota archaeon]